MADIEKRRSDRFNFLFIAGMWFQDLFNYDFRRTERCIIPYATQQGEISFCAYNTGIGWRNIIEKMHMTATLTKWYEEHGRHEIFAGGKSVNIASNEHTSSSIPRRLPRASSTTSTRRGSPRRHARKSSGRAQAELENKRMADLYRQVVLKEQPTLRSRGSAARRRRKSRPCCTSRRCKSRDSGTRKL